MRSQIHLRGIAAIIGTALLLFSGAASAQLLKEEEKCVNTANKNAQKIASAQGKDISSCIKDGAKGKLTGTWSTPPTTPTAPPPAGATPST